MKALAYANLGKIMLKDRPKPEITAPEDAIVRVTHTIICGTDLHILKGDVPTATPGRILGHEGVGVIDSVGTFAILFNKDDQMKSVLAAIWSSQNLHRLDWMREAVLGLFSPVCRLLRSTLIISFFRP